MPLIDEAMVQSLERPSGSHSRFALYLLGALPLPNHKDCPLTRVQPAPDWKEKIICTKISNARLVTIRGEAKRIRRERNERG